MEKTNKYYPINKRYLAEAMSFLGFKYMKFNNYLDEQIYSFEDTAKFRIALNKLTLLKKEINN